MSALTNNERDGLEDVFLSIHSGTNSYINIKDIYSSLKDNKISISLSNLLKHAKLGLKKGKSIQFSSLFSKKKKSLR